MHASETAIFMSASTAGVEVERVGDAGERLPDDRHALRAGGQRQADVRRAGSFAGAVPVARAASIAASRPLTHREHGHEPGDVEDPLDARLDRVADADDEALARLERAPARVEQRAEHRGVDERRGREVDHDAAAAASASSRRSRRVGAV